MRHTKTKGLSDILVDIRPTDAYRHQRDAEFEKQGQLWSAQAEIIKLKQALHDVNKLVQELEYELAHTQKAKYKKLLETLRNDLAKIVEEK
jgi:hypothetical protein